MSANRQASARQGGASAADTVVVLSFALAAIVGVATACDDGDAPSNAGDARVPMDAALDTHFAEQNDARVPSDAASDARMPSDAEDAEISVDPKQALRERGEYLVRHVAGCMECHTPRLPSGKHDESRLLAGVENLFDVEPDDPDRGAINSRNLTPHPKNGLGAWTDEEIKRAFREGIDKVDKVLHWSMPYWIYRNMRDEDADAIVAFLRSIPEIEEAPPDDQLHEVDLQEPYEPYSLPLDRLPRPQLGKDDPSYESAQRGFYLASSVSPCLFCHTPADGDPTVPIDIERAFSGKRPFLPVALGVTVEGDEPTETIDSFNLTPHENGIGAWSAANVARAVRYGVGIDELPVCDPMPSTTFGSLVGMNEHDALDLGNYFTAIAPQDSGPIERCCSVCHKGPLPDAGMPLDAGEPG